MQDALDHLCALIADGWEYPDAHAKASMVHHVDSAELQLEYDRQFS
jgi:hypothetical protein